MQDNELQEVSKIVDLQKLADSILKESDQSKLNELTNLFNNQEKKKKIVRASKLDKLLDLILDEMEVRLETMPGPITNESLISYWKVLQESIEKISDVQEKKDANLISLNQNNQVNIISSETLDTKSRKNVTEAVRKILQNISFEENNINSEDELNLNGDETNG